MTNEENIHIEYRHYRSAGLTLSATIITFGTVLLGWGLTYAPTILNIIFILSLFFALCAILVGFYIQLCQFNGYKHQARARFERSHGRDDHYNKLMDKANCWFGQLDIAVWPAIVFIVISLVLSVVMWWFNQHMGT